MDNKLVNPSEIAINQGYDQPYRYEWPGKEVHRFTTSSGKNVIQFLVRDKTEKGFVLKTWDENFLEPVGRKPPLDLQQWFGLSYSSFAVLPRVFMEAMPQQWQDEMAALLHQYDDAIDTTYGDIHSCEVVVKGADNRYMKMPEEILNYRHPDPKFIARILKNG